MSLLPDDAGPHRAKVILPSVRWLEGRPRPEGIPAFDTCLGVAGCRDSGDEARVLRAVRQMGGSDPVPEIEDRAYIVWHEERQRLVAVRDALGALGLYYRQTSSGLRLSGRATDLIDGYPSARDLDREELVSHLCGEVPHGPSTYFRGIRQVPAGSMLVATPDGVRIETYWEPELAPTSARTDEEWEETLRTTLERILRSLLLRLGEGGDRRLGLTLSGGLDSGSLAVTLANILDDPSRVTALRWTAPELPRSDESHLSADTARRCGFSDLQVRADRQWTFCPPLGAATEPDSPLTAPYVGLWDQTFRTARGAGLRHLLTGGSGDHLLAGNIFADFDLLLTGRWLRAARSLTGYRRTRNLGAAALARHVAQLAYWSARMRLGRSSRRSPAWLAGAAKASRPDPPTGRRGLPGRMRHQQLLRDPVRAETLRVLGVQAARYDLSLLHPLLDHQMFRLVSSIPLQQLFRDGINKHLVRRAFRGALPASTTDSPGKILPTEIFHRGMREREVDRVRDLLTDMRAADLQLVEPKIARHQYEAYLRGEVDDPSTLWPALTLEAWLRQHIS